MFEILTEEAVIEKNGFLTIWVGIVIFLQQSLPPIKKHIKTQVK